MKNKTVIIVYVILAFVCCKQPTIEENVYSPIPLDDGWELSSPSEQGLNKQVFDTVYRQAAIHNNIYSIVVVKNGFIISERYYNGMEHSDANSIASVTKSYISALTGIAIRERVIPGINAKLMDYFPEIDWESLDPRKMEITIQQMLQMRTGYPWEEREGYYNTVWERRNDLIPLLAEFPLTSNPGTTWGYSNMTSHFLGIIIARAYSDSILSFGNKYLFGPLRVIVKAWPRDSHDYYFGSGDIFFTPREMARFGLLYLNKGVYKGLQLIPTKWIEESLTPYSFDILAPATIKGIQNLHYGYQWYCGTSGTHDYHFAWGQGGNFIFILHDLNMVITVTADSTQRAWEKTRVIFEMMGEFISKL